MGRGANSGRNELGTHMPIRLIIENTPSGELAPMPQNSLADFIETALRTAKHSKFTARTTILTDVSEILRCQSDALSFLFEDQFTEVKTARIIDLDVPDYRMSTSEIYKEAAE